MSKCLNIESKIRVKVDMIIYFQVALLLLSSAPSYLVQIARMYRPLKIMHGYGEYVSIMTLIALFNAITFGLPSVLPSSLLISSAALGSGLLYYILERIRLSLLYRNTIRLLMKNELSGWSRSAMGIALIWVAFVEELIFRWYLLRVPTKHEFLPLFWAILLSSIAFGFIHQNFGLETVISRALFGLALAIIVLLTNNLLFAILSHVVYNILVHTWPMQYTIIRYTPSQAKSKNQQSQT